MQTLIIAEKPSLGRNIASALGATQREDGCLVGNGYIVTWAFGHLFSLADVEAYTETADAAAPDTEKKKQKKSSWTLDNLPCFPKEFRFELRRDGKKKSAGRGGKGKGSYPADTGIREQFAKIKALCKREDVDRIVNAGDADREGEIIVRLVVSHAVPHNKKPFLRLWLPDQTEQTIRAAAAALETEAAYDNLANEGYARTYVDWLYGVNLTRYASVRTGKLLRVGRVIVPIVRAIYDRDMAIRNFVPTPYLAVLSKEKTNGEVVELVSKKEFPAEQRAEAERLCALYNAGEAVVTGRETKRTVIPPGKLYSLSKLQNVLGRKYKMSMDKSLSVLQGLYEKGYVTYPRTNSEYLATAEKEKIGKIIDAVAKLGYAVTRKEAKSIFDDSKIESHSALTPTYKIPSKEQLSEDEGKVYATIFRRFAAVFCEKDCIAEKTTLTVTVREKNAGKVYEVFPLHGTVILEPGWMKYDDAQSKDKILPALAIGDYVNIRFTPAEKETQPPKHYTIETLNNYLKNPFRDDKTSDKKAALQGRYSSVNAEDAATDEKADDTEDYRAVFEGLELGTEATRTGIIDNARKSGYIDLKKDVYTILPDGEFLIQSLEKMQISMDKYKTATLGRSLKRVFRGEDTIADCVALAEGEIAEIFGKKDTTTVEKQPYQPSGKRTAKKPSEKRPVLSIGTCPLCGKTVVRGNYAYGCMGYKDGCGLRIGTQICGREILPEEVYTLLLTGSTPLLRGFTSKKGKPFDAYLKLKDGKAEFAFEERFPQSPDIPPVEKDSENNTDDAQRNQ